jgi:cytochrome c oxidase subunit 3
MFKFKRSIIFLSIFILVGVVVLWVKDIIFEGMCGYHNVYVLDGIKLGVLLFIFSEIIFFFRIFWFFFDTALAPMVEIGEIWPPYGFIRINPYSLPLLNSFILLSRAIRLTWAHYALISNKEAFWGIFFTVVLAWIFLFIQGFEYVNSGISFRRGVYGRIFFFSTGFHGLHVALGVIFLSVSIFRILSNHFNRLSHFGLEFRIIYWHFVDIVWLFLYIFVYFWSFY